MHSPAIHLSRALSVGHCVSLHGKLNLVRALKQYFSFVTGNRRFLCFGFLAAFFSSFGQTFFISIFGPDLQAEFGLSHTRWGFIYMLGTLGSAALLPWSGKFIDHMDLRRFAVLVCLGAIVACFFITLVSSSVMLVLAIFLLRQSGQGLMSHMGLTSMTRYFHNNRGRAIAIATLGFAAGEACLPFLAVILIVLVGWRGTYALAGIVLVIALGPLCFWLLRGHEQRHSRYLQIRTASDDPHRYSSGRSWTRRQMLGDTRFYLLIPGVICPSMVSTALFFHHLNLADAKHWSHAWITGSYSAYAASAVMASLVFGPSIDRVGARPLVRWMLLPLLIAVVIVANFQSPWIVWPYMLFLGVSTGLTHTGVSALWAELYGTDWLGSIRALAVALGVFSSAIGPVIIGVLMDHGVVVGEAFLYFIPYSVFCAVLMNVALSMRAPR